MEAKLTEEEIEIVDLLVVAASKFFHLKAIHPSDQKEFAYAIHLAQNLIFARVGMRQFENDNGYSYMARVVDHE